MPDLERERALRHIERIIQGLEEERRQLLERLSGAEDINDALELRHRLDKADVKLVESFAVRAHLRAAEAVRPPKEEMTTRLDQLLAELAQFEWQSAKISSVISTARNLTRAFGRESRKARDLA